MRLCYYIIILLYYYFVKEVGNPGLLFKKRSGVERGSARIPDAEWLRVSSGCLRHLPMGPLKHPCLKKPNGLMASMPIHQLINCYFRIILNGWNICRFPYAVCFAPLKSFHVVLDLYRRQMGGIEWRERRRCKHHRRCGGGGKDLEIIGKS